MGLSRKDRLAPGADHPVRQLIDRLSEVIGVKCDAYEHPRSTPLVTVALTEPVCLIVSARLASLPEAQQVFLLARALAAVAVNLHPVLVLPAPDLQRLVDGGTDVIVPGFAGRSPQAEDIGQRIKKTISRRWRKLLETAAPAYAAAPLANLQAWQLLVIRIVRPGRSSAGGRSGGGGGGAAPGGRARHRRSRRRLGAGRGLRPVALLDVPAGDAVPGRRFGDPVGWLTAVRTTRLKM